ncbi:hypothetical protein ACP70R_027252 [Stipagrostis hirtigluma subsp. patula]
MSTLAPFLLPGLAGVAPHAAPWYDVGAPPLYNVGAELPTMTTYVEAPDALCGYGDDGPDDDIDALLRDIDAVARQPPIPVGLMTRPVAAGADAVLQFHDAAFEAWLTGIRSVHVPATGLAPFPVADHGDDTPTTPVAELPAPLSYGDDDALEGPGATIKNKKTSYKKQLEPCEPYDADIDASFRAMEKHGRPSAAYLWTTQAGEMTMAMRAELVEWMHAFSGYYDLAPGALHRAVSYADRFLSVTKIGGAHQLRLLGAVAVFAAAKYEDRTTTRTLDADVVARHAGCTRSEVLDAERQLVESLGYRLSGPTAHTFVDHFTRNVQGGGGGDEGAAVRSLAHHLADLALLDYRCVAFLPSAVAASAIVLAASCFLTPPSSSEALEVAGYALEDLTGCIEAIYDMHEFVDVWPGCAQMMASCVHSYSLPRR